MADLPEPIKSSQFTPFHPNNTPFNTEDGHARYLAWNAVGKVIARREPISGTVSIDVDFADVRHHRPIRFTDDYNLSMAFVDDCGCVFASEETVVYMPTAASTSWSLKVNTVLELDTGLTERVVSVACNSKFIYCLTNEHLRIVNTCGCQIRTVPLPGRLLCVTANNNMAVVLYGEEESVKSLIVDADLNLTYTGAVTRSQPVWLGPSLVDDCELFGVLDEAGKFYVLLPFSKSTPQWTLLHRQPQTSKLWPVFFTTKHVHAVQLYDGASAPDILPVPLVAEVPFAAPLLNNPFETTLLKLTGNMYVDQLMVPHSKEQHRLKTAADKNILELIQVTHAFH